MAHRKLTIEDQLKGVRAALRSPRTPAQLKEGLRRREQELSSRLQSSAVRKRNKKTRSVRDILFG